MNVDFAELFRLDVALLDIVVRTSVMYLALIVAIRFVGRREMGALELPDLLMLVLIADGVQNAMAGQYQSITGGLVVAGTLIGWNFVLDWLTFRVPLVRGFLQAPPLPLVKNGVIQRRNLRREMITVEELHGRLREQGIGEDEISQVKLANMESNGEISVLRMRDTGADAAQPPKHKSGMVG